MTGQVNLIPAKLSSPSKGEYYPTVTLPLSLIPQLAGAGLGSKINFVVFGVLKGKHDYRENTVEEGLEPKTVEIADRIIEIHFVGVTEVVKGA